MTSTAAPGGLAAERQPGEQQLDVGVHLGRGVASGFLTGEHGLAEPVRDTIDARREQVGHRGVHERQPGHARPQHIGEVTAEAAEDHAPHRVPHDDGVPQIERLEHRRQVVRCSHPADAVVAYQRPSVPADVEGDDPEAVARQVHDRRPHLGAQRHAVEQHERPAFAVLDQVNRSAVVGRDLPAGHAVRKREEAVEARVDAAADPLRERGAGRPGKQRDPGPRDPDLDDSTSAALHGGPLVGRRTPTVPHGGPTVAMVDGLAGHATGCSPHGRSVSPSAAAPTYRRGRRSPNPHTIS